jgi:hypothetical protein
MDFTAWRAPAILCRISVALSLILAALFVVGADARNSNERLAAVYSDVVDHPATGGDTSRFELKNLPAQGNIGF